jgi:hypothetical protein
VARRRYSAGDPILIVKRSHRLYWLPHFYRHIGGGVGCHWLRLFFFVERPTAVERIDE